MKYSYKKRRKIREINYVAYTNIRKQSFFYSRMKSVHSSVEYKSIPGRKEKNKNVGSNAHKEMKLKENRNKLE